MNAIVACAPCSQGRELMFKVHTDLTQEQASQSHSQDGPALSIGARSA
jgi:hypothetical protein